MTRSNFLLAAMIYMTSGCAVFGQHPTADSLLEKEIHKAFSSYPTFLANDESAYVLVKVEYKNSNNVEIYLMNESRTTFKNYFAEKLNGIAFGKYLDKNETLLIPVFFLNFDDLDKDTEFLKVNKTVFETLFNKEKILQKVNLLRPVKIISASKIRTQ